jgi:hypothetical protein
MHSSWDYATWVSPTKVQHIVKEKKESLDKLEKATAGTTPGGSRSNIPVSLVLLLCDYGI